MNVAAQLLAAGRPAAPALLCGHEQLTYGQLRGKVERMARQLLNLGFQKQDRVGIWSKHNDFFVATYLATIRAGMVAVPLESDLTPQMLAGIIHEADINVVLICRQYTRRVPGWLTKSGARIMTEPELLQSGTGTADTFPAIDPADDLAALMFTSGSTGKPKGVMVTHRNIACNTSDIVAYLELRPTDRAMLVLPLHYCFGLSVLHSHLAVGASVVLSHQFPYPEQLLRDLIAFECTNLAGVPSTFEILLRKSRFKTSQFPSLRFLQQAGGNLPVPIIHEIMEALPGVRFYVMYGQTEATARLSYLPPELLPQRCGSIGKGLRSTKLEVLHPDGTPVEPGSGEVGEIVASGENIALGYWKDPAETAKFFRNGKLYTGDLARLDRDGFIYIVEREREFIKCGGNRVSSREVEEVISELPEVIESAVVGVPHPLLGEAIRACVVLARDAATTERDVMEHCRGRLPSFKVPELVILLRNLPHNSNGKVAKSKLKAIAAGNPAGSGFATGARTR